MIMKANPLTVCIQFQKSDFRRQVNKIVNTATMCYCLTEIGIHKSCKSPRLSPKRVNHTRPTEANSNFKLRKWKENWRQAHLTNSIRQFTQCSAVLFNSAMIDLAIQKIHQHGAPILEKKSTLTTINCNELQIENSAVPCKHLEHNWEWRGGSRCSAASQPAASSWREGDITVAFPIDELCSHPT